MPRPTGPCSVCLRNVLPECEHLANTYDRAMLKGMSDQDLIEYACNRMLALNRDNGNKAEGVPATRTYKSRNEIAKRALANLCGYQGVSGLKCIRGAGHFPDTPHKF